jgi:uncharacterized membrane protein (DUF485 family)
MVKKKENLLAFGMFCLIIAFAIEILGNEQPIINLFALGFILIAMFTNAIYIVEASFDKKKK